MKQKITLSIALVMSIVLLSLTGFASTANAAPAQRYVADTGAVTLGPNQILRLTVTSAPSRDIVPTDQVSLNFAKIEYQHGGCTNSSVCLHTILSQTTTEPVTLRRGEASSMDITQTPNGSAVRGLVYSNSNNIVVNAEVVDITTGATVSAGHVKVFNGNIGF